MEPGPWTLSQARDKATDGQTRSFPSRWSETNITL